MADRVHLLARLARLVRVQDRLADSNGPADQLAQSETECFDVCPDGARRNGFQTQSGGVCSDLLAFDEADLAAPGSAAGLVDSTEVARFTGDSLGCDEFDGFD